MRRRVADAARAMEGQVIAGDPQTWFEGAAIDSRRVAGGELFFALEGTRTDGHRFVADALARGAAAAVVHREVQVDESSSRGALIRVADTYGGLHALTRWIRRQVPQHLVAITGSVGKTTTKELLAAMLAQRYRVARSPGNLNNLLGFPLALLACADDTEWMVAEMGMSTPGELGQISRLGQPDVAVFTNVRPAHLEFFGELRAIGDAKAELLEGLGGDGLVVANAQDPEVVRIGRRYLDTNPDGRVAWYGLGAPAAASPDLDPRPDLWASAVVSFSQGPPGSRFTLETSHEKVEVRLPLHGEYNVENCLAAAACAHQLGLSLGEIAAALNTVEPAAGRGEVHRLRVGSPPHPEATLVDDSYNANPDAVAKALASAARLEAVRRWVVLGDMLELGPEAPRFHREAGREAVRLGFSPVVAVGMLGAEIAIGARTAGGEVQWFPDAEAAARWAAEEIRGGDLVLVKGSRGAGLENVVRRLLELGGPGEDEVEPPGTAEEDP